MNGWFDDIGLIEDEETRTPPTTLPVCKHEWVPIGFAFGLEECVNCDATRGDEYLGYAE